MVELDPSTTYALLVGIEKYAAGSAWDLNGPANDVYRFAEWLCHNKVPTENISILLSPLDKNQEISTNIASLIGKEPLAATAENVNISLDKDLASRQSNLFFFFWAGHGMIATTKDDRRLFYADATSNQAQNLNFTALLNAMRTDFYKSTPRQIFFIDTCANYLPLLVNIPPSYSPATSPQILRSQQQFALFAANPGELATNKNDEQTGLFSSELLTILNSLQEDRSWPPDMKTVTERIEKRFNDLRKQKDTNQIPVFWWRDWVGNEKRNGQIEWNPPVPIPETSINWREVYSTMLEPQRRLTSNPLMQDKSTQKERKQIYVPLALVQRTKTDKRKKGDYSPDAGTRLYEPEYETQQRFEHEAFLSQILEPDEDKTKVKQIAVIGEPGAGKTTLLQAIAFWVLKKDLGLPIWISLADLGRNGTLTDIQTYIFDSWLEQAIPSTKLTQEVRDGFTNQIQQGRVWLLLDGVDEISGGSASYQPLEEISRQLTGWFGHSSRVVLTCRLNVWQADRNALETFETYRLLDFDYPQQVHQFIDNWFVEDIEKGERLKTELDSIERVRLQDMVQTPLRLALLCSIWQSEEGNLPQTKAGLYHQCVQQFYIWKQNRFPTSKKKQRELNQALGRLALRDINEGGSRFRLRESFIIEELDYPDDETSLFYKALQLGWLNHVGIAVESPSKEKVYAFYHATFEEYFAALAIDDWHYFLNHVPENLEQGTYHIFEPQWKEVILLWLGREDIKEEQKKEFIKALVEFDDGCKTHSQIPDWKGFYEYQAYFLAAAGIAEFKDCGLSDAIVKQIVTWGFGYFNVQTQDWQRFHHKIEENAKTFLVETDRKKATTALEELIGNSQSEEICWKAASLLGYIAKDNPTAITELEELIGNSQSEEICWEAASLLGYIAKDNPTAITELLELLRTSQSEEIRWLALSSLENIAKDRPTFITELLELIGNSQSKLIRGKAASILENIAKDYPIAITGLLELIGNSQSEEIRWQAAVSLGCIAEDNPTAITGLLELIGNSQSKEIRLLAAGILGYIAKDNPTTITGLLELIGNSQSEEIRWQAAGILGEIAEDNPTAITGLLELIGNSQSEEIRLLAAGILGYIAKDNSTAITALVELLRTSQSEDIQRVAAGNLGEIAKDNPTAITALVELTRTSQSEDIQRVAAESLGEIAKDNPTAITALVELTRTSQSEDIQRVAAESLGEIAKDNPTAITALVELTRTSQSVDTQRLAAKILQKLLTKSENMTTVVTALKNYLSNETYEVIWHCTQTLTYPTFYQAWHQE